MIKRRVALVALHFAEYSINLALALATKWDVLIIVYRDNAENEIGLDWRERVSKSNIALIVLERPTGLFGIFGNSSRIVRGVKEFAPDVMHCQEELRDELVLALPFLKRVPMVLTVHDPFTHSGLDTKRFRFSRFRVYRPWVRSAADAAITHGRVLAEELGNALPRLRNNRIFSLPHGPLGSEGATDIEVSPPEARLLFFGRIHEYKGLRYFVDAVISLHNRGYPVKGVVAGRGGDLAHHRAKMVAAGCFEIHDWRIPASDIPNLFVNALAVIVPYIDGTQSGVAAMALGFGRPVIATTVGSIPELVKDGRNGLLVPPSDSVALAAAMEAVVSDRQLWEKLANGARSLRDGELSWAVIADRTIGVYETVLVQ